MRLPRHSRATTIELLSAVTLPEPLRRIALGIARRLHWLARPRPVTTDVNGKKIRGEVVVYFAEEDALIYQLQQWAPVFQQLATRHPVVVVTRRQTAYHWVLANTTLPAILTPLFPDMTAFYRRSDPKLALYVNNGNQNFQSLASTRMLHVHVNHGESDKISMVSNQAKAYDRVFVAGQAAVLRHRAALLEMDESKLVPIGRPQLDLDLAPALPPSERRTILYAPTWEGEEDANNYTSVDVYGPDIVRAALRIPGVRFIYKPHPRVPISRAVPVLSAHQEMVRLIEDAARREPGAGHAVAGSADVLALLKQADLLVSDISSVTLDYLYLRTERPFLLTDRRTNRDQLLRDAPVGSACEVIDATSVARVEQLMVEGLEQDSRREERLRVRDLYFGGLEPGQSTARFLDEVDALMALRDAGIEERRDPTQVHARIEESA